MAQAILATVTSIGICVLFMLCSVTMTSYLHLVCTVQEEVKDSPYVVPICSIYTTSDVCTLCAGTLIRPDWILSSQLCLRPDNMKPLNIIVLPQVFNLQNSTTTMIQTVHEWRNNPSFEDLPYTVTGDISLLRLEEKFSGNETTMTLASRADFDSNTEYTFIFWPKREITSESEGNYLRESYVKIIKKDACRKILPEIVIAEDQVCARFLTGEEAIPERHSGGPLLCGEIQCGVFTWQQIDKKGLPVLIFTRLDFHVDYISSMVKYVFYSRKIPGKKVKRFRGSINQINLYNGNDCENIFCCISHTIILILLMKLL